jgi:predicted Zn-dependent peptidase
MKNSLIARTATLVFALFATASFAQDLTHPTGMALPESRFERPDPVDYQLALDNGLIAYIARANQVPLVTMSAFIRAGKASDTNQGAVEVLFDALKNHGPAGSSAEAFRNSLTQMTARYNVELHDEWIEVSLNVPTEDLNQALSLFASVIQAPSLSQDSITGLATRAKSATVDLAGEDGPALYEGSLNAAVDRFHEVLYDGHSFGTRPTAADYAKLTIDAVEEFHADYFVPGNMTLAIAGDINETETESAVEKLFGAMPFRDIPAPAPIQATAERKKKQHTFPADKLQSWLVFGHELPQVPLEDQAALEVMNYILAGGHLYTRMTVETRYKYGYTNDASGFLQDHWYGPGSYTFRSYSRPEVIKPIYDNMMREIIRIRREPVSDEELFIAKGALTDGEFQVRYLDGYALTRNFAIERLRHGNHAPSASYVARVRSVSADDVRDAANKYLHPEKMQVVLVGEPQNLLD